MKRTPVFLMVEDNAGDRALLQKAFDQHGLGKALAFVETGEELLEYLRRQGLFAEREDALFPDVILLDLRLPKKDGLEVLKEIKEDPGLKLVPVIVITASSEEADLVASYSGGATAFVRKPKTFEELATHIKGILHYWCDVVTLPPRPDGSPRSW